MEHEDFALTIRHCLSVDGFSACRLRRATNKGKILVRLIQIPWNPNEILLNYLVKGVKSSNCGETDLSGKKMPEL